MNRDIAFSTIGHLLLIAALLWWPSLLPEKPPIHFIPIMMMEPPPPPPPPEEEPPPPEEEPPEEAIAVATQPPEPEPSPTPTYTITTTFTPSHTPTQEPERELNTPVPSPTPTNTPQIELVPLPTLDIPPLSPIDTLPVPRAETRLPDAPVRGPERPGGLTVQTDAPYSAYAVYLAALEEKCRRFWSSRIPRLPSQGGTARMRAVILFDIRPDGTIFNVRVMDGSGNSVFDEAAMRTIREMATAGPLPDVFKGESITVAAPLVQTY